MFPELLAHLPRWDKASAVTSENLVFDWGVLGGLQLFRAVLARSRVRFVPFAADKRAATTMSLLTKCFEFLGEVPKVVLAARRAYLRADIIANRVVPTPAYVRLARHYRPTTSS